MILRGDSLRVEKRTTTYIIYDAFGALHCDSDNLSKTWPGVNQKAGVILRRDEA